MPRWDVNLGTGAMLLLAMTAFSEPLDVGTWAPAGALSVGRYAPGAGLLPDGRVLVAGGYSFETDRTHNTADLFDPQDSSWSEGPRMRFDRNFPETLTLPSGDLLLVAGFRGRSGTTATTERLDVKRTRFVPEPEDGAPPACEERELFSVCRLADGRFLLTGGYSTHRKKTLASAEIFDPRTGAFTPTTGSLRNARFGHASVLLPDGRVLVVGGKVLATEVRVLEAELFDPKRGAFEPTGALAVGRDRCTGWLHATPDGAVRVLVAGGSAQEGGTTPARRSEVYSVATGKFTPGPELIRDRMAHTATPLPAGKMLLVGGWSNSENATTRQAEIWDPAQQAFRPAGRLLHGRHDHAAVLLKDGRVLVAGGKEAPAVRNVESPLAAELWTPAH
ncbi:MAG: Kelch repeat-containing protein [Actinomycetota bacterium]